MGFPVYQRNLKFWKVSFPGKKEEGFKGAFWDPFRKLWVGILGLVFLPFGVWGERRGFRVGRIFWRLDFPKKGGLVLDFCWDPGRFFPIGGRKAFLEDLLKVPG